MNNTNTNTNTTKNNNELGALWKKKSKTGLVFLSGYIVDHDGSKTEVVVFANKNKSNERAPDYRLYVSKPLNANSTEANKKQVSKQENKVTKQIVDEDEDLL